MGAAAHREESRAALVLPHLDERGQQALVDHEPEHFQHRVDHFARDADFRSGRGVIDVERIDQAKEADAFLDEESLSIEHGSSLEVPRTSPAHQ